MWHLWNTSQGMLTSTCLHGKGWLRGIWCASLCDAVTDCQQLPITHPILLRPWLHTPMCLSHASSSNGFLGFSQRNSNHFIVCIYITVVHNNVPNSCLKFPFLLVFTYTSHALFSAFILTLQHSIISILGRKAHNFKELLYNEHSKIKDTFHLSCQLLDHHS